MIAERSEKGLERAAVNRRERWERIVMEAAQQSRRDALPVLREVISLRAAVREEADVRLLLDEAAEAMPNRFVPVDHAIVGIADAVEELRQ